ncbi:ABC transporter ATP-binding protein [Streptomyces sp. P38-E01]|uniref:ABC transporter ATP-binding protein n=1 Tax=Streptomyces tardus TaxID=2780544 RepID=A0A949JDH8_9ACTN|nr:ABC transporter ATP-binding protein [Streptomyces tardus]MBU7597432.1 ABC transporter ATP-binding protein [Streptomyces tardus]
MSPSTRPLLSLDRLTRAYGSLTAVNNVSLELPAGARHALIGPNGAGKTTLLNLVAGTDRPTAGRISWDGEDLTRTAPARRSRLGIGRSFQHPIGIGELSALENVVLACWRHHPERRAAWRRAERLRRLRATALEQLDAVGLADVAHRPAGALSHGQRRMLDLAAALAGRPRLLLLDEPAAGLTDRDIERLLEVLGRLPEDVAFVLIEHHIDVVAQLVDTVSVLVEGTMLRSGPTREVLSHPDVRTAYLGTTADDVDPGGPETNTGGERVADEGRR